jgi:hypothetical protein
MMNISKYLIQTSKSKFLRTKNLLNLSIKLFAAKKKDGTTQSASESPSENGNGNVKVIESIRGNRVI